MISTTYSLQTDIASQNYWDSTQTITSGSVGYSDGLMIHNGRLMSTKNTSLPNNGNFATMLNGPSGNPDYSEKNEHRPHWYGPPRTIEIGIKLIY